MSSDFADLDSLTVNLGSVARLAETVRSTVTPSEFARIVAVAVREFGGGQGCGTAAGIGPDDGSPAPRPASDRPSAHYWTAAEEAELLRLHGERMTTREAAERLGRPVAGTRKRLELLRKGLVAGPAVDAAGWTGEQLDQMVTLRQGGMSFADIALRMGVGNPDAVRKAIRDRLPAEDDAVRTAPPIRPDAWTDAQDDQLASRAAQGVPVARIAADLGRTVKACHVRLSRLRQIGKIRDRVAAASDTAMPPAAPMDPAPPAPPAAAEKSDPVPAAVTATPPLHEARRPDPAAALAASRLAVTKDGGGTYLTGPEGLAGLKLDIWQHLSRLDTEDFTAGDDLYLAQSLVARVPMETICDQLGCDSKTALARFDAMKFRAILTDRKALTIDGQAALLDVLFLRAKLAKAA